MSSRVWQMIAPLLIIQRVANQSALASNTMIVTGHIGSFRVRSRRESTGDSGAAAGEYSLCLTDEHGKVPGDIGVVFETTIDFLSGCYDLIRASGTIFFILIIFLSRPSVLFLRIIPPNYHRPIHALALAFVRKPTGDASRIGSSPWERRECSSSPARSHLDRTVVGTWWYTWP